MGLTLAPAGMFGSFKSGVGLRAPVFFALGNRPQLQNQISLVYLMGKQNPCTDKRGEEEENEEGREFQKGPAADLPGLQ